MLISLLLGLYEPLARATEIRCQAYAGRVFYESALTGGAPLRSIGRESAFNLMVAVGPGKRFFTGPGFVFTDIVPDSLTTHAISARKQSPAWEFFLDPFPDAPESFHVRIRLEKYGKVYFSAQEGEEENTVASVHTRAYLMALGLRFRMSPVTDLSVELSQGIDYTVAEGRVSRSGTGTMALHAGFQLRLQDHKDHT